MDEIEARNRYWCLRFRFSFQQKTAYEMRSSDWSSDVCSSDLCTGARSRLLVQQPLEAIYHVRRREILAAVELDAVAQLERPGQAVVRHRPFRGQLRQHVELVVDVDQPIIDGEGMIGVVAGMHVGGIHRLLLATPLIAKHRSEEQTSELQ